MSSRLKNAVILVIVGVLLAAAIGLLAQQLGPAAPPEARPGVVTRVYDGDTVDVSRAGRVRLLGIDALDAHNRERTAEQAEYYGMSQERVRYWAGQAEEFARERLLGRNVVLKYGYEMRDSYGRLLAYVHAGDQSGEATADFNLLMIEEGLASAYRRFDHPRRREYIQAEQRARGEERGFWQDVPARRAD
jgi:micrococcal nuclease